MIKMKQLTDNSARIDAVMTFRERFKSFKLEPNLVKRYFMLLRFNGFYLKYKLFDKIKP